MTVKPKHVYYIVKVGEKLTVKAKVSFSSYIHICVPPTNLFMTLLLHRGSLFDHVYDDITYIYMMTSRIQKARNFYGNFFFEEFLSGLLSNNNLSAMGNKITFSTTFFAHMDGLLSGGKRNARGAPEGSE